MANAPSSLLIGQAGVWRVAAKLALLGINPLFPGVDHGYDLSAEGCCRVQVKAAGLRKNRVYPKGAYFFKFWQAPYFSGTKNVHHRPPRDYSQCSDVMVLWGITEDRFWIVPSALMAKGTPVALGPRGFYQREDFAETKRLFAEGLSQSEIGRQLGISQPAVSYQLRGGRTTLPRRTMTSVVREHEDRWDLIKDAAPPSGLSIDDIVDDEEEVVEDVEEING